MGKLSNKTKPGTNYDVKVSVDFLHSDNYRAFCNDAYEAHEKENDKFFLKLSDDELVILYVSCYLHDEYPLTLAYTSEVMDSIFERKNGMQLLKTANAMIFRNLAENFINDAYKKHFKDSDENISTEDMRIRIIEKVTR